MPRLVFHAQSNHRQNSTILPTCGHRFRERLLDTLSRNQPRAATKRQILESPLNENENAALKLHDVHQVDKQPDHPGDHAGDVQAKDVGDSGGSADYRHIAFIEIMEWLGFSLIF
jgi:hypothetical protein